MFVHERFTLSKRSREIISNTPYSFGFDGYGNFVFLRTYSRTKACGTQEKWPDTVIRVIEGLFSVVKDVERRKVRIRYDEDKMQEMALSCALSMVKMQWLPPGRGLWIGGTEFMYERGAAALMNCGYAETDITSKDFISQCGWVMDMLMCGVGVGFSCGHNQLKADTNSLDSYPVERGGFFLSKKENEEKTFFSGIDEEFVIDDSREGWVKSTELVLYNSFILGKETKLNYEKIRRAGLPIKGFGGTSSGPEPLKVLHRRLESAAKQFKSGEIDSTRTVADIVNMIGACVVAGNVRRSAEIALGNPNDETFLNLKNRNKFPDREAWSWLSNNSAVFSDLGHFSRIPDIAERIVENGEPGFLNMLNIKKYARYGKEKYDNATGANPCSEIPLAPFELCCLSEVFPSNCKTQKELNDAIVSATFYATAMSTLMTHREESNEIINQNHRIGVSISGLSEMLDSMGSTRLITTLRNCYSLVDKVNAYWCARFGIRESIRKTTVKPSGTISLLAGTSAGMHFPTFKYAKRRTRLGANTPIGKFLIASGANLYEDKYDRNTLILETPVFNGRARPAKEVSAWEQVAFQALLQREWADNMVSCTVYFDPKKESKHIESLLAQFAPVLKSSSLLPHTDEGCYENPPFEGISKEEYEKMKQNDVVIKWENFTGSDGTGEKFCSNESCNI